MPGRTHSIYLSDEEFSHCEGKPQSLSQFIRGLIRAEMDAEAEFSGMGATPEQIYASMESITSIAGPMMGHNPHPVKVVAMAPQAGESPADARTRMAALNARLAEARAKKPKAGRDADAVEVG
jgi:hypothetical protein